MQRRRSSWGFSRSARVIFDTVGGPTFEPALKALAHRGRQVEITSVGDRRMSFDLVNFHLPTDVFVQQVALIVPMRLVPRPAAEHEAS